MPHTDQESGPSREEPRSSDPTLEATRLWLSVNDAKCPNCGYALRGSRGGGCPECSAAITLRTDSQRVFDFGQREIIALGLLLSVSGMLYSLGSTFQLQWPLDSRYFNLFDGFAMFALFGLAGVSLTTFLLSIAAIARALWSRGPNSISNKSKNSILTHMLFVLPVFLAFDICFRFEYGLGRFLDALRSLLP